MKKTLLFALIALVFYTACTRISTTEIGTGLIPAVDGINTFDTTYDVYTDNVLVDSIRTSKYQEQALGYISNDPIFGQTKAILNLELKPQYFPHIFEVVNKDSLFLDSAVLVLKYLDVWGDSTLPISFNVFELQDKMKADSVYPNYYSSPTNTNGFPTKGPQLNTTRTFDIRDFNNTGDTNAAFKEPKVGQIRIPLTTTFGNKLLKTFDTTPDPTNNAYRSDSIFSERFHGFSIIPSTGSTNALLRISLQDTNTKVAIYYRCLNRAGKLDTTVKYFRPGFSSASANNIIRTRTGSPSSTTTAANLATTVVNGITIPNDSMLYLQSGPGHRINIKIPNLGKITNRVVHRAELYMEQVVDNNTGFDDKFIAPNLFLSAYSKDSNRRFHIPNDIGYSSTDGTVSNLSSFGGYIIYKYDNLGKKMATYAFNISRYVQGIATKKEKDYDLSLFAPVVDYVSTTETSNLLFPIYAEQLNPPGIGRVRLGGGSSVNHKMKLRIIYSKL